MDDETLDKRVNHTLYSKNLQEDIYVKFPTYSTHATEYGY